MTNMRYFTKIGTEEIIPILILDLPNSPFLLKEFSDFLMPMLEFDPKERVTAEEALQLPFFKDI